MIPRNTGLGNIHCRIFGTLDCHMLVLCMRQEILDRCLSYICHHTMHGLDFTGNRQSYAKLQQIIKLAKVYIFTYCGVLICRETWVSQFRIFTTAWGSESARRRYYYLVVFTGMV